VASSPADVLLASSGTGVVSGLLEAALSGRRGRLPSRMVVPSRCAQMFLQMRKELKYPQTAAKVNGNIYG
jgi:hypothetical protein